MKRIALLLTALLLASSTAYAGWKTNLLLAVTAFGSVPSGCTSIGGVSRYANEVIIFNSLNQPVTVSTDSGCTAAETMIILGGVSAAITIFRESQTSDVTLYYKYTSSAPTAGNITMAYITDR